MHNQTTLLSTNSINFICHVAPPELTHRIEEISNAAFVYQMNVVKALAPMNVFSVLPLPCTGAGSFCEDSQHNIRYFNGRNSKSKIFKIFFDYFDVLKAIRPRSINLFYSINVQSFLLVLLSKLFRNTTSYIIVADYEQPQNYKTIHRRILQSLINSMYRFSAGVISLSENTEVHKNTIVIPALIESQGALHEEMLVKSKTVLFSGSIGVGNGIDVALASMDFLPDHMLYITGKLYFYSLTDLQSIIQKSKHQNIKFLGNLSREEYLELLKSTEICLNLRDPNLIEHQYNFPSKITEYLSFNKKVVTTIKYKSLSKFELFFAKFDPLDIAQQIKGIGNMPTPSSHVQILETFGFEQFRKKVINFLK